MAFVVRIMTGLVVGTLLFAALFSGYGLSYVVAAMFWTIIGLALARWLGDTYE